MSTTMSQPSFPILLFTQLARRLQHTNARYNQIAYQCRHTQRPTHHAKQRAYRVGLWIDTSRARPDTAASTVLDRIACSPVWGATETETGREEDAYLPNPWPEMPMKSLPRTVVVHKRPVTPSLSPLELGLSNIDDVDACDGSFRGPVPGAPRWKSRPLPEDDSDCKMQAVTNERVSFEASCTYDAVLRDVITRHASDSVSTWWRMVSK